MNGTQTRAYPCHPRSGSVWRNRYLAFCAHTTVLGLILSGCTGNVTPGGADSGPQSANAGTAPEGPAEPGAAGKRKISIANFTFDPETLEVAVGSTVIWVNADDVPHTVRSTEDLFRSEALDTDAVFEHRFWKPGTYEYYCGLHRHMAGRIVVKSLAGRQ